MKLTAIVGELGTTIFPHTFIISMCFLSIIEFYFFTSGHFKSLTTLYLASLLFHLSNCRHRVFHTEHSVIYNIVSFKTKMYIANINLKFNFKQAFYC